MSISSSFYSGHACSPSAQFAAGGSRLAEQPENRATGNMHPVISSKKSRLTKTNAVPQLQYLDKTHPARKQTVNDKALNCVIALQLCGSA